MAIFENLTFFETIPFFRGVYSYIIYIVSMSNNLRISAKDAKEKAPFGACLLYCETK